MEARVMRERTPGEAGCLLGWKPPSHGYLRQADTQLLKMEQQYTCGSPDQVNLTWRSMVEEDSCRAIDMSQRKH